MGFFEWLFGGSFRLRVAQAELECMKAAQRNSPSGVKQRIRVRMEQAKRNMNSDDPKVVAAAEKEVERLKESWANQNRRVRAMRHRT